MFKNFGAVPKQTKIVPKRRKVAKKTYIVIPILRTTSGGGAEKDNSSAETEKIGAENAAGPKRGVYDVQAQSFRPASFRPTFFGPERRKNWA